MSTRSAAASRPTASVYPLKGVLSACPPCGYTQWGRTAQERVDHLPVAGTRSQWCQTPCATPPAPAGGWGRRGAPRRGSRAAPPLAITGSARGLPIVSLTAPPAHATRHSSSVMVAEGRSSARRGAGGGGRGGLDPSTGGGRRHGWWRRRSKQRRLRGGAGGGGGGEGGWLGNQRRKGSERSTRARSRGECQVRKRNGAGPLCRTVGQDGPAEVPSSDAEQVRLAGALG
ncbi:hypothetical protein I4F81_009756 [Pyropia yezoensis]|uniref:Uncharacterized protein n=1 Tax=Pyropia yezoensis TaxID=2788 RepID=A0ACC3CBB2_PYRYE|nr:hypothetical protein I4F81_009756 [Neopyropia yezoensis]